MSRKVFSSKTRLDIFGDFRNLEALSMDYKLLMDSILDSRDRITNERKSRYIIEVTKENIDYCKELMKIFDLRHLDDLTGNFILRDDKYSFISTNVKDDIQGNKEEKYDKNVDVSIIHSSTSKVIKQQQKLFDTFWHNSLPADEKIRELENEKEKSLDANYYDFADESLTSVTSFNKDRNRNIVQITRDNNCIKSLLMSSIYNAKSEILLTVGSLGHFKSFWKLGLEEGLKHAIAKGVRIIILYPEDGKSDITKKDITNLVSNIEENVHLNGISGTIGSVMIADNAKILLIDDDIKNVSSNNDIIGIFSNNRSLVRNFGSLFDILVNEKEVLNYIITTRDQLVSSNQQLKESNQRLKIYSEAQQEFIDLAAHELRTPTQAILGYIELLDTSTIESPFNQNHLNSIVRNANRLARLVEDLLDVSRIESNRIALKKEKTNLQNLIDFVINDFRVDLQKRMEESKRKDDGNYEKNIEVFSSWNVDKNENPPSVFEVMIDRSKIIQVISNLINNSLNSIYNDKSNSNLDGNSVMIEITKIMNIDVAESDSNNNHPDFRKNELLITIKDTGKGLDPGLFPRLFEKFATNSSSGTGLGLFISKAIVEAHEGRIWAENNMNEKGATFRFTLPSI